MIAGNVKSLLLLYLKPVAAISRILDSGRLWCAIAAAFAVSFLLHWSDFPARVPGSALAVFISYWPGADIAPLVDVAIVMVPAILLIRALAGFGSFSVLMNNDYWTLLMCVFMSWAAAYLPLALAHAFTDADWIGLPLVYLAFNLYFTVLAALSVRTLFGIGFGAALGMTILAWGASLFGASLIGFLGPLLYLVMSPFVLFFLYLLFASDLSSVGAGLRSRQRFQQQLEISTTNPHDADAQYQLGLICQKRRQYSAAIERFERAFKIDPTLADAEMQLGVIARAQNRTSDAITYLERAAALDDKLAQSEVWRELGAAYLENSRNEDAAAALAKFTSRHPYDPEGLYWYGKTLAAMGHPEQARTLFERAIESVRTLPSHRRAQVRSWAGRARKEL